MKSQRLKSQKGQNIVDLNEDQARDYIESLRWPEGPCCIDCGSTNVCRLAGKTTRKGLLKCRDCKAQFTVTVGTIFEDSHIPLAKWVRAFHLMTTSKKGMSALQLQRNLGLGSYRTAWHMAHRIRWAMSNPDQAKLTGQVQVDETFIGGKPRGGDPRSGFETRAERKTPVMVLVETDGNVRAKPIPNVTAKTLRAALDEHCDPSARIVTDDWAGYPVAAASFADHKSVNHSAKEYARKLKRADGSFETITTNTAEAYFSLLKRGIYGTFHHVGKHHLHRYCDEFSFRWNGRKLDDIDRCERALRQIEGKRLMYRMPAGQA